MRNKSRTFSGIQNVPKYMNKKKVRDKGMLSLEYAAFIAILIAALLAMSVYMQRAICAKFRDSGDTFGYGRQYAP